MAGQPFGTGFSPARMYDLARPHYYFIDEKLKIKYKKMYDSQTWYFDFIQTKSVNGDFEYKPQKEIIITKEQRTITYQNLYGENEIDDKIVFLHYKIPSSCIRILSN